MENSKKSIFTKMWLGCFALLLTVSVYGMFGQIKGTRADEVYGPPAPSELTNKKKLYGIYEWDNFFTLDSLVGESFDVNFKTGYSITPGLVKVITNEENASNYNKISISSHSTPIPKGGTTQIIGMIHDYYVNYNETNTGIHKRYVGYYSGSSYSDYGRGALEYQVMDFGTSGSLVSGDKYCTAAFNPLGNCFWGEWKYYDAELFVKKFKESTSKVNACYSDEYGMHWGHGSDYINSTFVPVLDYKTDCDRGIKVTFKTNYGKIEYDPKKDTFYSDRVSSSANENEVTLYLPVGTYDIMEDLGLYLYDYDYTTGNVIYKTNLALSDEWKISYGRYVKYPANGAAGPPQIIDNNVQQSTHLVLDGTVNNIVCEAIFYDFDDNVNVAKVEFFSDGGTKVPSQYVVIGQSASKPTNPTKPGYNFSHWYRSGTRGAEFDFNTKITNDMLSWNNTLLLNAKWVDNPKTYRVILYEGCTVGEVSSTVKEIKKVTVNKGQPLSKEHDLISGDKIFLGWSTSSSCDRDTKKLYDYKTPIPRDDYKLYAVWSTDYTVTFDPNGGTLRCEAIQKVKYGESLEKPNDPVFPGTSFLGWYLNLNDDEPYIFSNNPLTSDITLYAKWGNIYTIKYDANGGSYAPEATTYFENKSGQISLEFPRYLGHRFVGWDVKKDCSSSDKTKKDYARGNLVNDKNLILYACWEVEDANERCSLRDNPDTGDNNLVWLILLEIVVIGSLIGYLVMKNIKNNNVS